MEWILTHVPEILAAALAVSEGLAAVPQLKSNSILQLATNVLKALSSVFTKKEE